MISERVLKIYTYQCQMMLLNQLEDHYQVPISLIFQIRIYYSNSRIYKLGKACSKDYDYIKKKVGEEKKIIKII